MPSNLASLPTGLALSGILPSTIKSSCKPTQTSSWKRNPILPMRTKGGIYCLPVSLEERSHSGSREPLLHSHGSQPLWFWACFLKECTPFQRKFPVRGICRFQYCQTLHHQEMFSDVSRTKSPCLPRNNPWHWRMGFHLQNTCKCGEIHQPLQRQFLCCRPENPKRKNVSCFWYTKKIGNCETSPNPDSKWHRNAA